MKLNMTFSVNGTDEVRTLVIPPQWLECMDYTDENRFPTLAAFMKGRRDALHTSPTGQRDESLYNFEGEKEFSQREIARVSLEELDLAWKEIDVDINFVDGIMLPIELEQLMEKIKAGPHRVSATDAEFQLLREILLPIAEQLAEGPARSYEPNVFCTMLKGDLE